MSEKNHLYAHAFLHIENVGSETLKTLTAHFGDLETAWHAPATDMLSVPKIRENKKVALAESRSRIDPKKEWARLREQRINLLTIDDPEFPSLLREIPDAPYTLYTEGTFDWTNHPPMIALVGSRKFTAYGEQVAAKLSEDLTRAGFLVVSGLAFGIDSVSHEAALEAGGQTIAVLGSGLRQISPSSHIPLAKKIIRSGAVVSEYHPQLEGNKWSFPARNRIIAGMTHGTVVIEAAEGSGSLITAQCALEYNREVFAVPGSIFSPYSLGTNSLIKRGAKLVTGVQDILEELPAPQSHSESATLPSAEQVVGLSPDEHTLLTTLTHEPLHIDLIIKQTKLPTAQVSTLLSLLEIKGLAKNVGGMHYVRVAS